MKERKKEKTIDQCAIVYVPTLRVDLHEGPRPHATSYMIYFIEERERDFSYQ